MFCLVHEKFGVFPIEKLNSLGWSMDRVNAVYPLSYLESDLLNEQFLANFSEVIVTQGKEERKSILHNVDIDSSVVDGFEPRIVTVERTHVSR